MTPDEFCDALRRSKLFAAICHDRGASPHGVSEVMAYIELPATVAVAKRGSEEERVMHKSDMDVPMVHMVRDAAKEVLGLNYTFVDDDLATLAGLARRACEAGMLTGLHPDTEAAIRRHYAAISVDENGTAPEQESATPSAISPDAPRNSFP